MKRLKTLISKPGVFLRDYLLKRHPTRLKGDPVRKAQRIGQQKPAPAAVPTELMRATIPADAIRQVTAPRSVNTYPPSRVNKGAVSTEVVVTELRKRGIRYERNRKGLQFKTHDGRNAYFRGGSVSCNTAGANLICLNKEATKAFLRVRGAPVARSDLFSTAERDDAMRYAAFLGYPVVLKRVGGMGGSGVWPNIQDEAALLRIWNSHLIAGYNYMVEKHAEGGDFRFLVADDTVIAVLERQQPVIVGDGIRTVEALVTARNDLRGSTNNPVHKRIPLMQALSALESRGIKRHDVPAPGERIVLKFTANISSGGDAVDMTDAVPAAYKELALECVRAVQGLRVAGVDIIIGDLASSPLQGNCTVLEINHNPMLSMHHYPWIGEPRNVASTIVDILLGKRRPAKPMPIARIG